MVLFLVALVAFWAGFILGIFAENNVDDDLLTTLVLGLYGVTVVIIGYLIVRGVMAVISGV